MTEDELQKLLDSLKDRLKDIDLELSKIASEDPLVKGDFNVVVEDVGSSQEDTAQEAVELDRRQALVDTLERERKKIMQTIEKIDKGGYGKCENCSSDINIARLKAMPRAMGQLLFKIVFQ